MRKNSVEFYEKSKDKNETISEVSWGGVIVGTITVPTDDKYILEFKAKPNISNYYIRRVALQIYRELKRDVFVQMTRKSFTVTADLEKKNQAKNGNKKPKVLWRQMNNLVNVRIGKYREFKCDNGIGAEMLFVKLVKVEDAFWALSTLLKNHAMVKFTVSQMMQEPVEVKNTLSKPEIMSIVMHVFTWYETKRKYSDSRKQPVLINDKTAVKEDEEIVSQSITENAPKDIDPAILLKVLTLTMNKKSTVEEAKRKAQITANTQNMAVKLLDTNGHFVCNLYPQKPDIRNKRLGQEIQNML